MHKFIKPGVYLGGVIGVLVLVFTLSIFKISIAIAYRTFDVQATPVARPNDAASRERGAHLVNVVLGCTDCHGDNLGGKMLIDDPGTGVIAAPNLTRGEGGRPPSFVDIDYIRAIRHGVDPINRGLWLMPTQALAALGDADMGCVLADIDARPPVAQSWPDVSLTMRGRTKVAFRQLRLLQVTEEPIATVPAVAPAPNAAYGAYLAQIANCTGCHGTHPGALSAPLSRDTVANWSGHDLGEALRVGRLPTGQTIHDNAVGRRLRGLNDVEIAALWAHLQTLY